MEITRVELNSIRLKKNLVLVESITTEGEIEVGGVTLKIDTSYNPSAHAPRWFKVIGVPKELIYGKELVTVNIGGNRSVKQTDGSYKNHKTDEWITRWEPIEDSMPWKCSMDLAKDDLICVAFYSIIRAESEGRVLVCEGKKYYLINYNDIYLKKQGDSVVMLNGYLLLEPIKAQDEAVVKRLRDLGVVLPTFAKESDKLAVVSYIGLPVEEYLESDKFDTDEIALGSTVRLAFSANRRLEDSSYRYFSQTELIVSRRHNIAAVLNETLDLNPYGL